MKNLVFILFILVVAWSCNSSKTTTTMPTETPKTQTGDTLTISSDKLEYDIIIIEPGFNTWLVSQAHPKGYHSQSFLETKNGFYVTEWNNRVLNPNRFNPNLYEMQINYQRNVDYGYDVNYKLYNYFIFFQNRYNQNLLGGFIPQR